MIIRAILPQWAADENLHAKKVREGKFSSTELKILNNQNYNIYYLPNYPSTYEPKITVDGSHIDRFECVFVDMDLKEGVYKDKEEFKKILDIETSLIVDSGNGIHA